MRVKEEEVTRLKRVLAILKNHTWGSGNGEALANALGGTGRAARACSVPNVPPPLASGEAGGVGRGRVGLGVRALRLGCRRWTGA